jgi:hypothetical protein
MTPVGRELQAPALAAPPARTSPARLAWRAALVVLAVAVLFFCYWRQSRTAPLSSDGSANVLQAWDMLHGNPLLRQWWVSDVSFYTTELPQYMLVEVLTGLGPWVVHVAAAMTYTLLVLFAAVLAGGTTRQDPPLFLPEGPILRTGGLPAPPSPPGPPDPSWEGLAARSYPRGRCSPRA